jgi:hypothetical protein
VRLTRDFTRRAVLHRSVAGMLRIRAVREAET